MVAAAAGFSLGLYVSEEPSGVTAMPGRRAVTITIATETRVRTIARPDRRSGRRVFANTCSRCPTLKPGDWRGDRVNLTDLRPSYRVVVEKVIGGGIAMPSFQGRLSERQIRDVAAFVAAEAARRGGMTR